MGLTAQPTAKHVNRFHNYMSLAIGFPVLHGHCHTPASSKVGLEKCRPGWHRAYPLWSFPLAISGGCHSGRENLVARNLTISAKSVLYP